MTATDNDLLRAIKTPHEQDKLDQVREMARAMRDLTLQVKDLEDQIEQKQRQLTQLSMKDLPDLFEQHNVRSIGLEAEGNLPAYDVVASPYYKAVLPKEEDEGLRWLEANGHGDMIKRQYVVNLAMDTEQQATALRSFLEEHDLAFDEKETVPWTTLTAFVKEQIEKRKTIPPLDILGATVGKIVKLKPKKMT
jgi:hypothetical protein